MAALRDRRQYQPRLHHGKAVADADTRAAAEREKRVARDAFFPAGRKTLGIESLGLVEEARVAVQRVAC